MRTFSREELLKYNGKDAPAYVACNSTVYDVSSSFHWKGGRHQVLHKAGEDLTENISEAPHRMDMLERFPVVGILARDQG